MSRSESIAKQLNMSHGAAANRLRKMVLFRQLKKHNENICIRCNTGIETVEELSIEHIKPWENISVDLFWDLDNVSFSHRKCNVPHTKGNVGRAQRKVGPEGTSWCIGHQDFLSIEEFYKASNRWTGLSQNCKYHHDLNQNHGTKYGRHSGRLAHLGERRTCNAEAVGAEPTMSTNF